MTAAPSYFSDETRAAVLDLIAGSPAPLTVRAIAFESCISMTLAYSVIVSLHSAREIRIAAYGPPCQGRPPRLYDTRVELGDAPEPALAPQHKAQGQPSLDRARDFMLALEPDELVTVHQVAADTLQSLSRAARNLRILRGLGEVRVACWTPQAGRGGRATPSYDRQTHLASVPEPTAATRSPPTLLQRQSANEQKRIKRAEQPAPVARPAFDPKTAINWKRAA
jgi:hypothetical protein